MIWSKQTPFKVDSCRGLIHIRLFKPVHECLENFAEVRYIFHSTVHIQFLISSKFQLLLLFVTSM